MTKPPPVERELLPTPAGEPDRVSAFLRRAERAVRARRRRRVPRACSRPCGARERQPQRHVPTADREVPVVAASFDVRSVETSDLDVGAAEVRLELRTSPSGTTAIPRGGSATIASAFASATRSTVPTSSRCSGPIDETTTTSGRAISQSAAICPSPRMPISVTSTRVSGSSRQTVSGRPISLFWLASAQIVGRLRAAECAEDVLGRGLPRRADDSDHACVAP